MAQQRPEAKVIQIDDDEWVTVEWLKQREMCCHCGLVHEVDHRVQDGQLQFRARQLKR